MTALATPRPHHSHRRPILPRRVLHAARLAILRVLADVADWRLARREQGSDESAMLAWLARVKISPMAALQVQLAVCRALLARVQPMPGAREHHEDGPPADAFNVLPVALWPDDDDPRYAHLNRVWSEDTGTFTKIAQEWTA